MARDERKATLRPAMTDIELAQHILAGRWGHRAAALDACRRGTWATFVREIAPKAPLLAGRGDFKRCLERAERSLAGPTTITLSIVPLWACSTEDAASDEWVAIHGVKEAQTSLAIHEVGPFFDDDREPRSDALLRCTVRQWKASTVVASKSYAPDIELELRAGAFAVAGTVIEEVIAVEIVDAKPLPRPTREVPMFATWFAPRVEVTEDLAAEIEACSFTADGEEDEPGDATRSGQ